MKPSTVTRYMTKKKSASRGNCFWETKEAYQFKMYDRGGGGNKKKKKKKVGMEEND